MNMERVWCRVCNTMVEAVIEEGAKSIAAPLLGGTAGGLLGASKGAKAGLAGMALGVLVGALVQGVTKEAQRLVCRGCGHHVA